LAQPEVTQDLKLKVPDRGCDGLCTATSLDGLFVLAHPPEARCHVRRHSPEAGLIIKGRGNVFGLLQVVAHSCELAEAD